MTLFMSQELKALAAANKNVHILNIDLKDFDKYPEIVSRVQETTKVCFNFNYTFMLKRK